MNGKKYTAEQLDWLREAYRRLPLPELVEAFNRHFGETRSIGAIRAAIRSRRITSGLTGRFEKENIPWNKGKKGYMGPNRTSYKPGNLPQNHRPLWSERIDKNGYVLMSVPERNPYTGFKTRFKHKHVWIWEHAHGRRTPAGHVVVFRDGDKYNLSPDNLTLVSRKELLHLNQHHYRDQPDELKPSIMALAKLEAKAGFRSVSRRQDRA